jgi:hypothetical protein
MFETRFYSSPIFWKTGKQKMSAQVKLVFLNSFFYFLFFGRSIMPWTIQRELTLSPLINCPVLSLPQADFDQVVSVIPTC